MGRRPRSGDISWLPAHSILKWIGGDTYMLDPLHGKSRLNPEKWGKVGPFWMVIQEDRLSALSLNSARNSHESNTHSTRYLCSFLMCDSGFGAGLDPPRSLHEPAE